MFASQLTIDIPDVGYILTHNPHYVLIPAALAAGGILLSVLVALYRYRYVQKHGGAINVESIKDSLRRATVVAHTVLASLITLSGGFLLFASENEGLLSTIPALAPFIPVLYQISNLFYNLGGNRLYQRFASWVESRKSTPETLPQMDVSALAPAQREPENLLQ